MNRSLLLSTLAAALLVVVTACDFNAASDAIDNLELVVEIPPLETVVNVQAIDAATKKPVSSEVQVTFEGADASTVIDVYSDPISSLNFRDGFASFGIDSTAAPTADDPIELKLRVKADGYVSTSDPLLVTREGSITRTIQLAPENPNQSASGTAGKRQTSNVNDDGSTNSEVTLETEPTSNEASAAQASATIPASTQLQTAGGDPLQGQVTTDLSVYDNSSDAQELLPSEALVSEDGNRRLVEGALRFQVTDGNGRVARQFNSSGSDETTLSADLPEVTTQNGSPVLVLVDPETGETMTIQPNGSSSAKSSSKNGPWSFSFSGNQVTATSPSGLTFGPFSIEQLKNFLATVGVDLPNTCSPAGELSIQRNGQKGSIGLSFSTDGFSGEATFSDSSDPVVVSPGDLFSGTIPDVGSVSVTVEAPDGQTVETTINWCSDQKNVQLPAPSAERIDATVVLLPGCPTGEKIPISGTVSGYTVNYRLDGSDDAFRSVAKEDIRVITGGTPKIFQRAEADLFNVLPGEDYTFTGALGSEGSSTQTLTMPTEDGGTVETTDEKLTDLCE